MHAARDVLADLPDEQRHPAAYHRDPLADTTDPAALAGAVAAVRGYQEAFMGTLYDPNVRRENAARQRTRERVLQAARAGTKPDAEWSDGDLDWIFKGHEHELEEARQISESVSAQRDAAQRAAQEREIIRGLAATVEKEWQQAARRAAYAEARAGTGRRTATS